MEVIDHKMITWSRIEWYHVAKWWTPRQIRDMAKKINPVELYSTIGPVVVESFSQLLQYKHLSPEQLGCYMRQEGYIPNKVAWDNVRFYWYTWGKFMSCQQYQSWEIILKQVWLQLVPPHEIIGTCTHCGWQIHQMELAYDSVCTFCDDLQHFIEPRWECDKCRFMGNMTKLGQLHCSNHT
jgi:hypothetical protein